MVLNPLVMEKKSIVQLDTTDRAILQLLQEDAFLTNKEIAVRLHLSPTPIFERIKRLEKEGFIVGYTTLLDRRSLDLSLLIFCEVSLKEHKRAFLETFESEIALLPEVMECHHITGSFDYLLKVVAQDMDDYQRFLKEKLAALDNIGRVESHFVMTEVKNTTQLPITMTHG